MVWFLVCFFFSFRHFYCYFTRVSLPLVFTSLPPISTSSSCFLIRSLVFCNSPLPFFCIYLLLPLYRTPPSWGGAFPFLWCSLTPVSRQPCFCFAFLISVVITDCVLTTGDLKLGASSNRQHGTFVCSIQWPAKFMISFMFFFYSTFFVVSIYQEAMARMSKVGKVVFPRREDKK